MLEAERIRAKAALIEDAHKAELALFEQQQKDRMAKLAAEAEKMRELGNNIGQGFADSLAEGLGGLADQMAEAMRAVIEAAKRELGIASPSKVFYGIAENTIKGFLGATEDGMGDLYSAGEKVGETYTEGANPLLSAPVGYTGGLKSTEGSGSTLVFNIDARGSEMSEDRFRGVVEEVLQDKLGSGYYRSLIIQGA